MIQKKFTTSAQKTLMLSKEDILKTLEGEMSKELKIDFEKTSRSNIKKAKLKDGSVVIIAGFEKENGKTLAMIDHKDLSSNIERVVIQNNLRRKLDEIFS
jgi:hypothetical protein